MVDHHKDRDCHWYFGLHFSYDGKLTYYVQHWGYIYAEIDREFASRDEAMRFMFDEMKTAILNQIGYFLGVAEEDQDTWGRKTVEEWCGQLKQWKQEVEGMR